MLTACERAAAAYLMAPNWPRAKLVAEAQAKVLLTTEALQNVAELATDDDDTTRFVRERQSVLEHAIRAGIPAGFASPLGLPSVDGAPNDPLAALKQAGTEAEMKKLLAEQPVLRSVLDHLNELQAALGGLSDDMAQPDRLERLQMALIYAWRDWQPDLWTRLVWDLAETTMDGRHDEQTLQAGIELGSMALDVGPPGGDQTRTAKLQLNVGEAYIASRTGDRAENIDLGITYLEQALQGMTKSSTAETAALVRLELGRAWSERLNGDRSENFDHAVEHFTAAVEVYPRDRYPIAWARTQAEIGAAYFSNRSTDWSANLELAKEHLDRALEVLDRYENGDLWAGAMADSASVYVHRVRGDRAANLLEAIKRYEAAAMVTTRETAPLDWATIQHDLGLTWDRLPGGDRANQLAHALECFNLALSVRTRDAAPVQRLDTIAALAHLHFRERRWEPAADAYAEALATAESVVAIARSLAGRRERLPQISLLSTRMAFCLLELGRPEEAFFRLEAGKTLLLSAERTVLDLGPGRLITLEDSNRREPPIDQLLERVPLGGALVAPVITVCGARAFVVRGGAIELTNEDYIPLPGLDTEVLQELLVGAPDTPGWLALQQAIARGADLDLWAEEVETFRRRLWDVLIGPIAARLAAFGLKRGAPVLLLPHGGLWVLPLHVASDGERAFLDEYTIVQGPSLDTLNTPASAPMEVVNPIVAAGPNLANADLEASAVSRILGAGEPLRGGAVTIARVIELARDASIVHLACHGLYDWEDPFESALVLADGERLTWRRVVADFKLPRAPLVTLSACETGVADTFELPDEVIGLATAFLLAGASGVVSSLWAVDDAATALLMQHFYARVREGDELPAALCAAQRWLRDADRVEIEAALRAIASREPVPGERDRPYSNPFFWAAWTFTGAPQ
jgi:CHAT domain-containing protein/tetratricopeptide (TPR) repeat protein